MIKRQTLFVRVFLFGSARGCFAVNDYLVKYCEARGVGLLENERKKWGIKIKSFLIFLNKNEIFQKKQL